MKGAFLDDPGKFFLTTGRKSSMLSVGFRQKRDYDDRGQAALANSFDRTPGKGLLSPQAGKI